MEGSIVNLNLVTIFYKLMTSRGRKNSLQDLRFGLASKTFTRDLKFYNTDADSVK